MFRVCLVSSVDKEELKKKVMANVELLLYMWRG